jgi:hypothetical protein
MVSGRKIKLLSGRLIHLIEAHQEQIVNSVIDEVRLDPELVRLRKLSDAELRERGQQILENLGYWMAAGHQAEIAQRHEILARTQFEQSIPLHESVRVLCIIKYKTFDFVSGHLMAKTSLELYAEEELERRVGRFFDALIIHMARGYEAASRQALAALV